jgi:hypothetical protein
MYNKELILIFTQKIYKKYIKSTIYIIRLINYFLAEIFFVVITVKIKKKK